MVFYYRSEELTNTNNILYITDNKSMSVNIERGLREGDRVEMSVLSQIALRMTWKG